MAGVPDLRPGENFAVAGNWGQFEGRHGLALNGAMRLDRSISLNAGVGVGLNDSSVVTRAGFRFGW